MRFRDHRLMIGVVAVHEVAVDVVEVGDDHEVEVALVDAGVGTEHVAADLGDRRGSSREPVSHRGDRSAGVASGVQRIMHDVAEHRATAERRRRRRRRRRSRCR